MTDVYIGIGSNVGDRHAYVNFALGEMADLPGTDVLAKSGIYETAPVGPVEQGAFLNAVAKLGTTLKPYDLLDALDEIMLAAGRQPPEQRQKWGPRTLDLDILLYGDKVMASDELTIPHPAMHERWFVLKPLCDIDPNIVHPILEMTVGALLKYLDQSKPT